MMEANRSAGGRPRHSIFYDHFVLIKDHEDTVIAKKCKYCDNQFRIKTSVTRLKAHLGGVANKGIALCKRVPSDVKEAARNAMLNSSSNPRLVLNIPSNSDIQQPPSQEFHTTGPPPSPQGDMLLDVSSQNHNVDSVDSYEQLDLSDIGMPEDFESLENFQSYYTDFLSLVGPMDTQQPNEISTPIEIPEVPLSTPQSNESCSTNMTLASQHLNQEGVEARHHMQENQQEGQRITSLDHNPCLSMVPQLQQMQIDPLHESLNDQHKHEKKRKLPEKSPSGKRLPLATPFQGLTFHKKVNEICASLEDDSVSSIGVYGMGGIGKTTIMKHIHNLLLEDYFMPFRHVIWITVSHVHSITKLQHHLARQFDVTLSHDENEEARAASLYAGMRNKCYALILDDVWEKINLEQVGIPEPHRDNGCKLILTTRSLDVCKRMQCKPISLDLLLEEEAWELFVKTLDVALENSILEGIMKEVAKECGRLPLAIVTVAGSMRGVNDVYEWRNALNSLRKHTVGFTNIGEEVRERLKFSYYRLSGQLQECLLICALFPEDCAIDKKQLIMLLISMGIIGSNESLLSAYDLGYTILNKLVNACLLIGVVIGEFDAVVIHDLVRDMCVDIAGCCSLVKCGSKVPPNESEYTKDVETLSLIGSEFKEIPSDMVPYCPKLSTLLLLGSINLTEIPDSFFTGLLNLQVLDLSETSIRKLPDSVTSLVSLNALVLQRCRQLRRLPCLAPLKALKKLDVFESGIKEAPKGLEELVHLTYLDLDGTDIRTFPRLILRNFVKLQHLSIGWVEITIDDVKDLKNLECFTASFAKVEEFNKYASSLLNGERGPAVYDLRVCCGPISYGIQKDMDGKTGISLVGRDDRRGNEINCTELMLPQDVEIFIPSHEFVEFVNVDNFVDKHVLSELVRVTSSSLHMLPIRLHHEEKTEESGQSKGLFDAKLLLDLSNLKGLSVRQCTFMEEFISFSPSGGVFGSSLKVVSISECDKFVRLVDIKFLSYVQNLETIAIAECMSLESLISEASPIEEEESEMAISFPKLRHLILHDLENLRSIYDGTLVCPSIETIHAGVVQS